MLIRAYILPSIFHQVSGGEKCGLKVADYVSILWSIWEVSPRAACQQLGLTFTFEDQFSKVEAKGVSTILPQFSCSEKPGLAWTINHDNNENAAHSKTIIPWFGLCNGCLRLASITHVSKAVPLTVFWTATCIKSTCLSAFGHTVIILNYSPKHYSNPLALKTYSSSASPVSPFLKTVPAGVLTSWNLALFPVCSHVEYFNFFFPLTPCLFFHSCTCGCGLCSQQIVVYMLIIHVRKVPSNLILLIRALIWIWAQSR